MTRGVRGFTPLGFEGDTKRRALADLVEQHPVGLGQLLAVADSGSA